MTAVTVRHTFLLPFKIISFLHVIMRWLLVGCFILGLNHISAHRITQKPRFIGVKMGSSVLIQCSMTERVDSLNMQWYRADAYDQKKVVLQLEREVSGNRSLTKDNLLTLHRVQVEDSGVYFCQAGNTMGPGTQLIVVKATDLTAAQHRTTIKDGLIIVQALLLALFIAALLMQKRNLSEKEDSEYEMPENDHIYQGLAIETCNGGMYEELTVYAQPDGSEAPWE